MSERVNMTIEDLNALLQAFNDHDINRIVDGFAEDGVFVLAAGPAPDGQSFQGREAIREALATRLSAVPDIQWTDAESWLFGKDNDRGLTEWRVRGTLPDGTKLDCRGCDLWRFRDGKVVRKDTFYKQTTG